MKQPILLLGIPKNEFNKKLYFLDDERPTQHYFSKLQVVNCIEIKVRQDYLLGA
jgi:hypothetical protein